METAMNRDETMEVDVRYCCGLGPITGASRDFEFRIGPDSGRVCIWGVAEAQVLGRACPDGWEIDWHAKPISIPARDGKSGHSHPLYRSAECECGEITEEACAWWGHLDETVLVEYVPAQYRETCRNCGHRVGRTARARLERTCAERLVAEEDGWVTILEEVRS